MPITIDARLHNKKDTLANWTTKDPKLFNGELVFVELEDGTVKQKVGNGTAKFSELPYISDYDDKADKSDTYTKAEVDKLINGTKEQETVNISATYNGTPDDDSIWGICWGTTKMMVKCADIPDNIVNIESGTMSGIRADNEYLKWSTTIDKCTIDTSEENIIYINFQNQTAEPQPITRAVIVKLAGTYYKFQEYSNAEDITFTEPGVYLLDKHKYYGGNDYTSSLNITVNTLTSGSGLTNPTDHTGNEIEMFNRGICIGDSVTEGAFDNDTSSTVYKTLSYPYILKKMTGMDITNAGISGVTSTQWYNASLDSSTYTGTWNENGEWVGTSSTSALSYSGYDFAIIHLGINDIFQISDTNTIDNVLTAFDTAIRNIVTKLTTDSPGIKIFLCTIIPNYASGAEWDSLNDKIKSLATELSSVYLINLTKYSKILNGTDYEVNHPTKTGYNQLAKELYAMISYCINKNLSEFNNVSTDIINNQPVKNYATKDYVDDKVVDNLTSNDSDKALSANQGKILNESKTNNTKIVTDAASTTSTLSMVTDYEYRFSKSLTSLTITLPTPTDNYISSVIFKSGDTATVFNAPTNCRFIGDDCDSGTFTPIMNAKYNIIITYDGEEFVGVVGSDNGTSISGSQSNDIGKLTDLSTTNKDNIVSAINEVKTSVDAKADKYTEDGGFVAGEGASNYVRNAKSGIAIGKTAESENGGVSIGYNSWTGQGVSIGYNSGGNGVTIGKNAGAYTEAGNPLDAIQLGTGTNANEYTMQVYDYQLLADDATTKSSTDGSKYLKDVGKLSTLDTTNKENIVSAINGLSASIDNKADRQTTDGGFAAGDGAKSNTGGSVGNYASTTTGGAVGDNANSENGGAVGDLAITSDGFAGGFNAQTIDSGSEPIDAVQLGTGINDEPYTMKVYDYQLIVNDAGPENTSAIETPSATDGCKYLKDVGKLSTLDTTNKDDVVSAINEVKTSVDNISTSISSTANIIYGTYTGNGETTRTINIGATPNVVIIQGIDGVMFNSNSKYHFGGVALSGTPCNYSDESNFDIQCVENGFKVCKSDNHCTNTDTKVYMYIAFIGGQNKNIT